MQYILKRKGRYYFNRRVPSEIRNYDPRSIIRIALKTDSRKEALRQACFHNDHLESYWKQLIQKGQKHALNDFENLVHTARLFGFSYMPNEQIAQASFDQIYDRLKQYEKIKDSPHHVAAILGGAQPPKLKLSEAIHRYFEYAKAKTLNKSPNQVRKWQNPRKLAMASFTKVVGDKEFGQLTREDLLKYQDWWISRIGKSEVTAATGNKNIVQIKVVIETVNGNLNIGLDTRHLFQKLMFSDNEEEGRRAPFTTEYIVSTLLNPENLKGLNEQARWVLHAIAETGAGISEQVGLLPEDIVLDADIPHIIIMPRHQKALKTKYRKRVIPLVGYALDAFKACPDGFTDYRDRPDSLSGVLSKYLKENSLLPTTKHTVYSLRHSFQDRLLAVNAPDRVQSDLMGHKFGRPSYAVGSSLEQKYEWLNRIRLKNHYSRLNP